MKNDIKAVILAAGRGSRLKELTRDKPKCLNTVGDRALIEWQINALREAGIDDIVMVTGYCAEAFSAFRVRRAHNPDWAGTNMLQSLLCARDEFASAVIVSYSDILYSSAIVKTLRDHPGDAVITYDTDWLELWSNRFQDPLADAESFRINGDGQILEIGKRPDDTGDIQGQYMGLMKFSPEAWEWITQWVAKQPGGAGNIDMTTMIQGLIDEGRPVYGTPVSGGWCEIDSASDLALAEEMHSSGRLPLA